MPMTAFGRTSETNQSTAYVGNADEAAFARSRSNDRSRVQPVLGRSDGRLQ
jgi:hypothetical protein